MSRERLDLAFAQIPPGAWEDFEQFASEFLIGEFPNLRTMARAAGDEGRDADIFSVDNGGRTKLQYSVTTGWRSKIINTVARLKKFNPKPTHLIYVTNQKIGPEADDLKREVFADEGMIIDVRDRSYFLDRRDHSAPGIAASELLCQKFLEPLLTKSGVKEHVAPALTIDEERLAFLHISIDLLERDAARNMTKSAYESIVLGVLHGSTHENPLSRAAIHQRINSFVHAAPGDQVAARIDAALQRLCEKRGKVKRIREPELFHIANDEAVRISKETAKFLAEEASFEQDILTSINIIDGAMANDEKRVSTCVRAIREIIEKLLLDYGEQFSAALNLGRIPETHRDKLQHLLTEMSFKTHLSNIDCVEVIRMVVEDGADNTREHLRRLLDSYTVLAMLKSTSDVQKTLRKIFTGGQIWLDTSVILPLMAERLYGTGAPMGDLMAACRLSDMKLYVTTGVIEEVNAHLNSCVNAARGTGPTAYRVPFLLREYLIYAKSKDGFSSWQEEFRGTEAPLLDIEEFLKDEFGIAKHDLQDEVDSASEEIRFAAQDYWREVQERRRGGPGIDTLQIDRLTAHDVENSIGVIQLRGETNPGPAGHQQWWLTKDNSAKGLCPALESVLGITIQSPVIDPGFLVQLIRFRPSTSDESAAALNRFPVLLDIARMDAVPAEMIKTIEEIRSEIPTISPRVMRRKIRDEVNRQKIGDDKEGGGADL